MAGGFPVCGSCWAQAPSIYGSAVSLDRPLSPLLLANGRRNRLWMHGIHHFYSHSLEKTASQMAMLDSWGLWLLSLALEHIHPSKNLILDREYEFMGQLAISDTDYPLATKVSPRCHIQDEVYVPWVKGSFVSET